MVGDKEDSPTDAQKAEGKPAKKTPFRSFRNAQTIKLHPDEDEKNLVRNLFPYMRPDPNIDPIE